MTEDQLSTLKPLSPQQKILMQHIVNGLTQKEIEQKMGIKLSTIKKYMKSIRRKYGAKSTFQCIAILVACGALTVEMPSDKENLQVVQGLHKKV